MTLGRNSALHVTSMKISENTVSPIVFKEKVNFTLGRRGVWGRQSGEYNCDKANWTSVTGPHILGTPLLTELPAFNPLSGQILLSCLLSAPHQNHSLKLSAILATTFCWMDRCQSYALQPQRLFPNKTFSRQRKKTFFNIHKKPVGFYCHPHHNRRNWDWGRLNNVPKSQK